MENQVMHLIIPGDSNGIKIIELANWTGKGFIVPRTNIKDLKNKPEATSPALYFLFGEADESTEQKLYIGETEIFLKGCQRMIQQRIFGILRLYLLVVWIKQK